MNEKVAQALRKGKALIKNGYEKGNAAMDKINFLKDTTNKRIAWGVLGAVVILSVWSILFSGDSGPEAVFRRFVTAIEEKNPTKIAESLCGLENASKELVTSQYGKAMLTGETIKEFGRFTRSAKIISIRTKKGNRAIIKFRPTDKEMLRQLREERILGFKIEAVKTDKGWKIDLASIDPIKRQ